VLEATESVCGLRPELEVGPEVEAALSEVAVECPCVPVSLEEPLDTAQVVALLGRVHGRVLPPGQPASERATRLTRSERLGELGISRTFARSTSAQVPSEPTNDLATSKPFSGKRSNKPVIRIGSLAIALLLMIAALPLISIGVGNDRDALWRAGLVAFAAGGVLAFLTRYAERWNTGGKSR
jgi:hypothetical protein